jgi:hypothetical protein
VDPEVAAAIPRLVEDGVLPAEKGAFLGRVARGELVSLRAELRVALYLGVTLIAGGAALLVKENLDRIGPLTIALGLGAAVAACLAWVAVKAPPFAWGEVPSPHLALDYLLLLGALLAATDLAYVEFRFTPLGADWPWHLLVVAVFYTALAVRYDSRVVWSLALTTFAAWRGVSVRFLEREPWDWWGDPTVRANAIACGAAFALVGWLLKRVGRKAHFEPVAVHLGWLLVLGGLADGASQPSRLAGPWLPFTLLLLVVGAALGGLAFKVGRFWLFAMGAVALYWAVSRLAVEVIHGGTAVFAYFTLSAIAFVVLLLLAQRRMKESP